MIEEAKIAILNSSKESSVYIGCDSIRFKKKDVWYARYCTVIVLHVDSKHGCKLFHDVRTIPDYGNLKMRLMTEVSYVTELASELIEVMGDRPLSIHLDINPNPKHKSSIAVKEALGYVRGMFGFDPVLKPDAWCASKAADHAVRNVETIQ